MRLLSRKKRVAEDRPIQIASEDVLYLSGDAQLGRSDQRKLSPFSCEVVAGPKSPLIGSCAFGLNIGAQFSALFAPVCLSLCDVVILFAADDLPPKTQLPRTAFQRQSLHHNWLTLKDLKMR
jgi:hypothetical protein